MSVETTLENQIWWAEISRNREKIPPDLYNAIITARSNYMNSGSKWMNETDPDMKNLALSEMEANKNRLNSKVSQAFTYTRAVLPVTTVNIPSQSVSPVSTTLSTVHPSIPESSTQGSGTVIQAGRVTTYMDPSVTPDDNNSVTLKPKLQGGTALSVVPHPGVTPDDMPDKIRSPWGETRISTLENRPDKTLITKGRYEPSSVYLYETGVGKIADTSKSYYKEGDVVIDGVNYGQMKDGEMVDPVTGKIMYAEYDEQGRLKHYEKGASTQAVVDVVNYYRNKYAEQKGTTAQQITGSDLAKSRYNPAFPDPEEEAYRTSQKEETVPAVGTVDEVANKVNEKLADVMNDENVKKYAPYLIGAAVIFLVFRG